MEYLFFEYGCITYIVAVGLVSNILFGIIFAVAIMVRYGSENIDKSIDKYGSEGKKIWKLFVPYWIVYESIIKTKYLFTCKTSDDFVKMIEGLS